MKEKQNNISPTQWHSINRQDVTDWWNPSAEGAESIFKTIGAYYK